VKKICPQSGCPIGSPEYEPLDLATANTCYKKDCGADEKSKLPINKFKDTRYEQDTEGGTVSIDEKLTEPTDDNIKKCADAAFKKQGCSYDYFERMLSFSKEKGCECYKKGPDHTQKKTGKEANGHTVVTLTRRATDKTFVTVEAKCKPCPEGERRNQDETESCIKKTCPSS